MSMSAAPSSATGGSTQTFATGFGGGGSGGRIGVSANTFDDTGAAINVSGGVGFPTGPGLDGAAGVYGTVTPAGGFDEYDIVVNWGDGTSDTFGSTDPGGGIVLASGGSGVVGTFMTSHLFVDESAGATVTVTARSGGSPAVQTFTNVAALNVAPFNVTLGSIAAIDENGTAVLDVSFDDPGVLDLHTISIDWGDGGPLEVVSIPVGDRSAQFSHQYLDDAPSGTTSDTYTVSVSIDDGDGGTDSGSTGATVNNVDPVIVTLNNSSNDGCGVLEGQSVSLSGSYTDVGTLDTHTALINWGDGSPVQTVAQSGGAISGSHVYADAGFYAITYTLKDDDTGQAVEMTTAVIAGVSLQGGVLTIIGTNCNDDVQVLKQSSTQLKVKYDLGSAPLQTATFTTSSVNKIVMYLRDGCDKGCVSDQVTKPTTMFGDGGTDILTGGSGNDTLVGGDGCDLILGRGGNDVLIGGDGIDLIIGDGGSDILIAGTTSYDSDLTALDALMAEWSSNHSYSQRVANVTAAAGMSATRLNGNTFLINEGEDATVFDDGVIDFLSGGGDKDLFFASDEGCLFSQDWILDLQHGEFVEELMVDAD